MVKGERFSMADFSKLGKVAVVYFSATGTTARAAKNLAKALGVTAQRLHGNPDYTTADLDWNNANSRVSFEHESNGTARPPFAPVDVPDVNTLFIGYPTWWGKEPAVVDSFVESLKKSGKLANVTVVPFATSASSPADGSRIAAILGSDIHVVPAQLVTGWSQARFESWLQQLAK